MGKNLSVLRERVRFDSWSLPYWMAVGLGALAYYALAKLGLQFFSRELGVSPIWPASGLAVALIRLFGAAHVAGDLHRRAWARASSGRARSWP